MTTVFLGFLLTLQFSVILAGHWGTWDKKMDACDKTCKRKIEHFRICHDKPPDCELTPEDEKKIGFVYRRCVGGECPIRVTLSGSAKYGIMGQPFSFVCTLHNTGKIKLDHTMKFTNRSSSKPVFVVGADYGTFYQDGSICYGESFGAEYIFKCGKGTDKEYSEYKEYHLTIKKIKRHHDGIWKCAFDEVDSPVGYFRLKIQDRVARAGKSSAEWVSSCYWITVLLAAGVSGLVF